MSQGVRTAALSRAEMEAIIDRRESVLFDRRVISRKEDLPSPAEMAEVDGTRRAEAIALLESQKAAAEAQLARLKGTEKPAAR